MDKTKKIIIGSSILAAVGIIVIIGSFLEVKNHFEISLVTLFFGILFLMLGINIIIKVLKRK